MNQSTQQRLKIIWIIARLNIGGPAGQVVLTAEEMAKSGTTGLLVCGSVEPGEGDMDYYAADHGVAPVILAELRRAPHLLRDLHAFWKLYRLLRREKPDLIHTHTAKAGFIGRLAAWLAGVPVMIHTFHGHVFDGYFGKLKTWVYLVMERFVASKTDRFIVLTHSQRDELADRYRIAPQAKFTVVPLGLELARFTNQPRFENRFRSQWQIPADAPLIGIVGRLAPIKNHRLFVRAANLLHQQNRKIRFVVVGDGETRAETVSQVAAAGLESAFVFTGWQKELAPVYSDLSALVVCSRNEGTPVAILEALAAGCPVIATDVGGVKELLEEGRLGRLVPPDDASALAEAVLASLASDSVPIETRNQIANRFSVTSLVSALNTLYTDLSKSHL
jgi:glycosyltransferase involved in cell wall biosynthesis